MAKKPEGGAAKGSMTAQEAFEHYGKTIGGEVAKLHAHVGAMDQLLNNLYLSLMRVQPDAHEVLEGSKRLMRENYQAWSADENPESAEDIARMSADIAWKFYDRLQKTLLSEQVQQPTKNQ